MDGWECFVSDCNDVAIERDIEMSSFGGVEHDINTESI